MERLKLQRINKELVDKCVDLYIETFSKEPWNDVYESREQVVKLFNNHLNNLFLPLTNNLRLTQNTMTNSATTIFRIIRATIARRPIICFIDRPHWYITNV